MLSEVEHAAAELAAYQRGAVPGGLDSEERRRLHVWLRAVKRCGACGVMAPVASFLAIADPRCGACRSRSARQRVARVSDLEGEINGPRRASDGPRWMGGGVG